MSIEVGKVIKLPVTAWVVVDGVEFEITSLDIEYTSVSCVARVTFAVGTGLTSGMPAQVTNKQADKIILDVPTQIYMQTKVSTHLPGAPAGRFLLLDGYVVDSGPWRVSSGYGWGIEVIHKGVADLSTGSTSVWPFTTSVNFDWVRPNSALDGQWISSMIGTLDKTSDLFTDTGLWPTIQKFFTAVASGGSKRDGALNNKTAGLLAENSCIGSDGVGINAVAIDALSNVVAAKTLQLDATGDIEKFVRFIDQMLANDLRTMSFLKQIQVLADRCFFRTVPLANGKLFIVPFKTFEKDTLVNFGGDEIFDFKPNSIGDTRLAGLLLYGDPVTRSPVDGRYGIYGCYKFNEEALGVSNSPRGIVETVSAPSWLGVNSYDITEYSRNQFDGTVEASAPSANSVQQSGENPIESYNKMLKRYGNRVARELARQYRFRGSSASFSSYLRTDVGPQSTVRVQAPGTLGEEMALFGKIDKVRIMIDADSNEAKTEYTLAYARNQTIQEGIGSYDHPIFSDGTWKGQSL